MNRIVLLGLLFLTGCLSKPEQPPITAQEKAFIDSVRHECNCEVSREIDLMLLGRFAKNHNRGGYALTLNFQCADLKWLNEHSDSAMKKADHLINPLFATLNRDSKFNEITISFTCSTDLAHSSQYQDMFYTYKTDSLNKGQ